MADNKLMSFQRYDIKVFKSIITYQLQFLSYKSFIDNFN